MTTQPLSAWFCGQQAMFPEMPAPDAMSEPEVLARLLSRYSIGAKYLGEPGPDDEALRLMTEAALRGPDHGGLVPFRFAVVRGAAREALGRLFESVAREAGKDAESRAMERERAMKAPVTVTVIARIDPGHPLAPAHEQWIAIGGAVTNFLTAAHALGFGGKLLSGNKVRSPILQASFCGPGESLVGWIALGTPRVPPSAKHRKPSVGEVIRDWPGE